MVIPMATAKEILAVARRELGYTESPAGSNRTKYGKWFGLDGQPWCMMFVQWCFRQADAQDLLPALTASCGALMRAAQAKGCWITGDYQPGDVVIYDFPGGAKTDHCGIVVTALTDGVRTIEGNTGVGNDSNGGEVMERTRPLSVIIGAYRPHYAEETVEKEDDMDIDKLINSMTDEQLIHLVERIQAALAKRPISAALQADVDKAVAAGITDGLGPNKLCTRAQAAAMIVRAVNRT